MLLRFLRHFSNSSSFPLEIANLKNSELFLRKNQILKKSKLILQRKQQNLRQSAELIKVLNTKFDLSNENIYDVVVQVMIKGWHSPDSQLFLEILETGNPFFKAWSERNSRSFDMNGVRAFDPKLLYDYGIKSPRVYIQLMHCAATINKDFEKVDRIFHLYTRIGKPDQDVYSKHLSLISSEFKGNIRMIKPKIHSIIKNFRIQIPLSDWTSKSATSVMKSLLNISDFNSAVPFYVELAPNQKKLELYIFLITYLVRFKYMKDAEMIVTDLIQSKLELTVMAQISLLDYYARARKSIDYKALNEKMAKLDIPLSDWSRIWAIQIRAISLWDHVDSAHAGRKILSLLKEINDKRGSYDQYFLSTAVECLIYLVNCLTYYKGFRNQAYEFMELANSKGVIVDLHTIHAILVGQLNSGYKYPEDTMELMKKYSITPSATTMNYIIQIYAKADSPKIVSFHKEMVERDYPIYYLSKIACINSSIQQNDYGAFQYFTKVESSPLKPQDFSIMARGYEHFDKPELMRIIWNGISNQKIPADAFEHIIRCFIKHGDLAVPAIPSKKYIDLVQSVWAAYFTQGKKSTLMNEMMMKYLLKHRSDPIACMALFEESVKFLIPPSPQHMTFLLESSILPIESKWRVFEALKALHHPSVDDYVLMMKSETDLEKLAYLWEDFQSGDCVIDNRVVEAIKPLTDQDETLSELVQLQLKISQAS